MITTLILWTVVIVAGGLWLARRSSASDRRARHR